MHISKSKSQKRIDSFLKGIPHVINGKSRALHKKLGKPDAAYVFYRAPAFTKMLKYIFDLLKADGMRVFLGTYSSTDSSLVPQGYEDLLMLIFAPTKDAENPTDMGYYFTIFPGEDFDLVSSQLDLSIAKEWVKNYRDGKLPLLSGIAGKEDTKSIHYTDRQLLDFVAEIDCQKATGVKAYFCNVLPDEPKFQNQLLIDWVLTARIGNDETDFDPEDREGWEQRDIPGPLDTGSPCPPNHCSGELIP